MGCTTKSNLPQHVPLKWNVEKGAAEFGVSNATLRRASDMIELSTRYGFALWLALGFVMRGWARSASGDTTAGISWIEDGIKDVQATSTMLFRLFHLALKAEALHLANRSAKALKAIGEAQALAEQSEERWWSAELHRLRGECHAQCYTTFVGKSRKKGVQAAWAQRSVSALIRLVSSRERSPGEIREAA